MCVRIRLSPVAVLPIYDRDTSTITLPAAVIPSQRATAVRAVLAELAVVQPEMGAVCWCGELVDLTPRIPKQRSEEQVMRRGA